MNDLQLIIPMTGVGQRFINAGFKELKPLIKLAGETMISHVMKMYKTVENPIFIISESNPQKNILRGELIQIRPKSQIIEISAHKYGPSYAIWQIRDQIDKSKKTIVNYCDFSGYWKIDNMIQELEKSDGAILTYTGFHPHMLRNTSYAYVKESSEGNVLDIQEKNSYTDSPLHEQASAGAYGFKNGEILLDAIETQLKENISLNNEFYTSLTYIPMLNQDKIVSTVKMEKFFQWGTPEDVADWCYWHSALKEIANREQTKKRISGSGVILAAGRGSRTEAIGLPPKPLIKIGKHKLWEYSGNASQLLDESVIVTRDNLISTSNTLKMPVVNLNEITQGQAISAKYGLGKLKNSINPVSILSCDNVISEKNLEEAHLAATRADLVVWTAKNYPPATLSPEQYSWIKSDSRKGFDILLKQEPKSFEDYSVIIGNFTFNNLELAKRLIQMLEDQDIRINNEFYLDSLISLVGNLGMKVEVLDIPNFFAVGTAEEFKTYQYWFEVSQVYDFKA